MIIHDMLNGEFWNLTDDLSWSGTRDYSCMNLKYLKVR